MTLKGGVTYSIMWAPEYPESFLVSEVTEGRSVDGDDPVSGLKSAVLIRRSVLVDFVHDYSTLLKIKLNNKMKER